MKKTSGDIATTITGFLFFVLSTTAVVIGKTGGVLSKNNQCLSAVNITDTTKFNCTKAGTLEISSYVLWGLTILDAMAFIFFACTSGNKFQQTSVAGNRSALHYGTVEQPSVADSTSKRLVSNATLQNA